MIQYKKGNLLDVMEGHIIHGCNARGVMGGGVAKVVRETYPACYLAYLNEFTLKGLKLGTFVQYAVNSKLCIWNAITQETYGNDPTVVYVDYAAVERCFTDIALQVKLYEMMAGSFPGTVHIPFIGAGLGNGDWPTIEKIISNAMPNRTITVWSIDGKMPDGTPI